MQLGIQIIKMRDWWRYTELGLFSAQMKQMQMKVHI